jgi:2,3-bisphosphoglycerate-independent phosphoglycerate mutase
MKYLIVLADGMSDRPVPELDGKTPLQKAKKPGMDFLAKNGTMGLVKTVADDMPPGSDVANLAVMGYDPKAYYTGRSPIEAVSMGLKLKPTDVAIRCNLVTLTDEPYYIEKVMADYGADEITTEEARVLIEAVQSELGGGEVSFHAGISYRHCCVWKNGAVNLGLTAPHDISDRKITTYLPSQELFKDLMKKSYAILNRHPVNMNRVKNGLNPANSIWLWGEGTNLSIPLFKDKYGLDGSMISAVDLLKGLGICAGLDSIDVEGSTGNIHTDYGAEMRAAVNEFEKGKDFVFLHIEAPDECGHRGEVENKVLSIEYIDEKVLTPIIKEMERFGRFRIMLLPDHATPVKLKTHTHDAVPFVIYDSGDKKIGQNGYDEERAAESGLVVENGYELMDTFVIKSE